MVSPWGRLSKDFMEPFSKLKMILLCSRNIPYTFIHYLWLSFYTPSFYLILSSFSKKIIISLYLWQSSFCFIIFSSFLWVSFSLFLCSYLLQSLPFLIILCPFFSYIFFILSCTFSIAIFYLFFKSNKLMLFQYKKSRNLTYQKNQHR